MSDKISNIHDKFFKSTFGDLEVATDFLKNYLPTEILEILDLATIETQNGSFVDKKLKEQFSDMLFRVDINNREGYLYFLFEHKSYNYKLAVLQLLRYMVEIWESKIDKEKQKDLPVILPLLIYHDKGKWTAKTKLGDWIEGYNGLPEEMKKYIPDYEYLLYDLSTYSEKQVRLGIRSQVVMKMLSKARYASKKEALEVFKEAMQLLVTIRATEGVTNIVEACIRYMLEIRDDLPEEELQKIAGETVPEGSEFVMTVAERLRQEGKQNGIEEEKRNLAKNLLLMGDPIAKIAMVTGLTEKEIEEIKKDIDK